jgi:hypothetical protein
MIKLIILWISILLIVLMCLFPPWVGTGEGKAGRFLGYAYLFSDLRTINRMSGESRSEFIGDLPARIDLNRLFVQYAIVALITGGLLFVLKDKKTKTN